MSKNTLSVERLPGLIDDALAALSTDAASVGLSFGSREAALTVTMPPYRATYGPDGAANLLAWELFADALPKAVERSRLTAMHSACEADPPDKWSVYTTATTLAWLHMASRGAAGRGWEDNVAAILLAAEGDGEVLLSAPDRSTMRGTLRSRSLIAEITLGARASYRSSKRRMIARDIVPDTIAAASAGRHIGVLVDAPWLRDADVRIAGTSTGSTGTVFTLDEGLTSLADIPDAAVSAAPQGGPSHAPWVVTAAERAALDEVDAAAHRSG